MACQDQGWLLHRDLFRSPNEKKVDVTHTRGKLMKRRRKKASALTLESSAWLAVGRSCDKRLSHFIYVPCGWFARAIWPKEATRGIWILQVHRPKYGCTCVGRGSHKAKGRQIKGSLSSGASNKSGWGIGGRLCYGQSRAVFADGSAVVWSGVVRSAAMEGQPAVFGVQVGVQRRA